MERRSRPGAREGEDSNSTILPLANSGIGAKNGVNRASVGSRRRGTRGNPASSLGVFSTLIAFTMISLLVVGSVKWFTKDLKNQNLILLSDAAMSTASLEADLKRVHGQLDKVRKEKKLVEKKQQEQAQEQKQKQSGAGGEGSAEDAIKQLTKRLDSVHQDVQKMSMRDALEKFGPGPHKVEIELDFSPDSPVVDGNPTTFVIELASLDDMPHSVHLFLQMVSHKLWDGCSFMRNAGHVVQASSTPYYKTEGQQLRKKFKEAGFMSVAFQEYSPNSPHEKYTVGFAGRPGGPDWYVSTMDNTKNHGPGGQSSYDIPGEADPCFGKIIKGFDAVDRMHKLAVKPGWYNALENNVGIARATILA